MAGGGSNIVHIVAYKIFVYKADMAQYYRHEPRSDGRVLILPSFRVKIPE